MALKNSDIAAFMSALKIIAVGDIMLGDQELKVGFGVASVIRKKGVNYIFDRVKSIFKDKDIVFANLEAILSDNNLNPELLASVSFRGSPDCLAGLKSSGFNTLAVANNHVMGHGEDAFFDTIQRLEKSGFNVVGLADSGGGSRPVVINSGGKIIGFLGYSLVGDYNKNANFPYCDNPTDQQIISDITNLKSEVDILIVSIHWGYEFIQYPSPRQIQLARRMVEAGANVILGHHPHCLQGMELYQGALICYSLGNFAFDFKTSKLRSSMILSLEFDQDNRLSYSIIPVYINHSYQPLPLWNSRRGRRILERIDGISGKIPEIASSGMEEYLNLVKIQKQRMRLIVRFNFILNLWRFPPRYIYQALHKFIQRRNRMAVQ